MESLICSFSVWQHVNLSVQIRPWDILACCWDVKQPTNKLYFGLSPSVSLLSPTLSILSPSLFLFAFFYSISLSPSVSLLFPTLSILSLHRSFYSLFSILFLSPPLFHFSLPLRQFSLHRSFYSLFSILFLSPPLFHFCLSLSKFFFTFLSPSLSPLPPPSTPLSHNSCLFGKKTNTRDLWGSKVGDPHTVNLAMTGTGFNGDNIEGFRPEWCISTIYQARDTPFWLGTLDIQHWAVCCLPGQFDGVMVKKFLSRTGGPWFKSRLVYTSHLLL